ncbi:hypothetical protein N9W49_00605 [Alphaproteobacteria bacterium]|nr:hypothetical protein [Alphaproteobacteria bacterium]
MSDKRYLGNIITQNPTAPDGDFANSAAKGVWSLEEQLAYQKAGLWPVPGKFLNVESVFSTYLYDGNGSTQTITNGIDLSGEGGLVWTKNRSATAHHRLFDTERGVNKGLGTNITNAEVTLANSVTAFNSNGFSLGSSTVSNTSGNDYASWTFRKAPKFFDVVTWTGNSTSGREIAHNLGSVPGMIIVKSLTEARQWMVYHRSTGNANALILNSTAASASTALWNSTDPTSTAFTLNNDGDVNTTGNTYVAYLFAHNDGDGEFGPDGDGDAIKCGSYTGNGSATGPSVDLGFEPQWLLIRNADRADDWVLIDSMRGIPSSSDGPAVLRPESSAVEYASGSSFSQASRVDLTATGFDVKSNNSRVNGSSQNMIYIAIRRGTKVPEGATDVFAVSDRKNEIPSFPSGFPVDFLIGPRTINGTDNNEVKTRLISGGYLRTNTTGAETASSQVANFAHNDGFFNFDGANANQYSWMWKRAPKYMDCVAYTGTGSARTVSHSLGVAPEMMWVKKRSGSGSWAVYAAPLGATNYLILSSNGRTFAYDGYWNDTTPTSSVFSLKTDALVNASGSTYIAYLFASLAGISKVGSVTHSGTTNVDCGFTSGARFVLLKRTDATGDWYVWDSERGIVSGNDPYLLLNSTAAEVTSTDYIDPLSSGFTITSSFTAGDYIFYAIA